jgi:hypothetical protein
MLALFSSVGNAQGLDGVRALKQAGDLPTRSIGSVSSLPLFNPAPNCNRRDSSPKHSQPTATTRKPVFPTSFTALDFWSPFVVGFGSGGGICTHDLQVMSLPRYCFSTPQVGIIAQRANAVKPNLRKTAKGSAKA